MRTNGNTIARPMPTSQKARTKRETIRARKIAAAIALLGWALAFVGGVIAVIQSLRLSASAASEEAVIRSEALEPKENLSTLYTLPETSKYSGRKGYENYTLITDETTAQYALQERAHTNSDGFRMINGRYLVAIGTYFDAPCGTLFDIILENGEKIPCIVGDIKSDEYTGALGIFSPDGCATAFIVDVDIIENTDAAFSGDISDNNIKWQSKVKALRVHNNNVLS